MVKKVQDWLFSPQSATCLGVFRALACGLCFLLLLATGFIFQAFFTVSGLWPVEFMERWTGQTARFSLLWGVTDDRVTLLVYLICTLAALFSALGLFTRWSLAVLFVTLVSLHHRSPDLLNSGDTLMRQWIFFLLVSPSGAAFSLDRLIALKKGASREVPQISSWPLRLIQVQLAIVYLTTLWLKWPGDTWRDGTATYISAQMRDFERFPVPSWWEQMPFVAISTYSTLLIELLLGTLVFYKPCRKWVLLGGLALHAGIEYSMNIPFFAFVITSGYIAFYRGEEVEGFARRLGQKLPFLRKLAPAEETMP